LLRLQDPGLHQVSGHALHVIDQFDRGSGRQHQTATRIAAARMRLDTTLQYKADAEHA